MKYKEPKKTSLKQLQKEQRAAVKKLRGQIEKLLNMPCSMEKYTSRVEVSQDQDMHMTATVYQPGRIELTVKVPDSGTM